MSPFLLECLPNPADVNAIVGITVGTPFPCACYPESGRHPDSFPSIAADLVHPPWPMYVCTHSLEFLGSLDAVAESLGRSFAAYHVTPEFSPGGRAFEIHRVDRDECRALKALGVDIRKLHQYA